MIDRSEEANVTINDLIGIIATSLISSFIAAYFIIVIIDYNPARHRMNDATNGKPTINQQAARAAQ